MNEKIFMYKNNVTVKKYNLFDTPLVAGSPSLVFSPSEYPPEVKSILYDFFISVEIRDKGNSFELTLHPVIDAAKLEIISLDSFGEDNLLSVSKHDDTYHLIPSKLLSLFYIQLSEGSWMMKQEIMQEIANKINKGLPDFCKKMVH